MDNLLIYLCVCKCVFLMIWAEMPDANKCRPIYVQGVSKNPGLL